MVEWGVKEDLEWCVDGIPKNSVIAIETYGAHKNCLSRYSLMKGFECVCKKLEPLAVIAYGSRIKEMEGLCRRIVWFDTYCKAMKEHIQYGWNKGFCRKKNF